MVLEEHARLLLVIHAVLGAALVGSTTHLVVWMRGFPRGRFGRMAAIRKFSLITVCLYVASFALGNLLYPTYKVHVRAEYLDHPSALARDIDSRALARAEIAARRDAADPPAEIPDSDTSAARSHVPRDAARIARWFDVKEHWAALGLALAVACAVLLRVWDPRRHGAAIAPLVLLLAVAMAAAAWAGAVIGLVVSSYRSVGGLG